MLQIQVPIEVPMKTPMKEETCVRKDGISSISKVIQKLESIKYAQY